MFVITVMRVCLCLIVYACVHQCISFNCVCAYVHRGVYLACSSVNLYMIIVCVCVCIYACICMYLCMRVNV